jgi:Tfp pilus assembly protein PilN
MIKINLFPIAEIKKRYEIKLTIIWNIVAFLTILIVFSSIFFINSSKISDINNKIAYNKQKLNRLRFLRIQLNKFKKDKAILQTKFKVIKELESFKLLPPFVMEIFSKKIPEKSWLTYLDYKEGALKIKGIAIDEPTIVQFINNLKQTHFFSKIELIQINRIKISGYDFKSFYIDAQISKKNIKSIL